MLINLPRSSFLIVSGLILVLALFLSGCEKKQQPVPPPTPSSAKPIVTPKPVQSRQTSAVAVQSATVQMDFSNKKDPFRPYVVPQQSVQKLPDRKSQSADLLPIQSYDVSKFKVSGIIAGLKENKALVIAPSGKGYVVKQGMLIGNNDGYISKITSSAIEVVESYREDSGRLRKRTITLTLPQKGKETSR